MARGHYGYEEALLLLSINEKILRKDAISRNSTQNRNDVYVPVEEKKTNQWRMNR